MNRREYLGASAAALAVANMAPHVSGAVLTEAPLHGRTTRITTT